MRPGVARANEDTADNLHRRLKRLSKRMDQQGGTSSVEQRSDLIPRLEAVALAVEALEAAWKGEMAGTLASKIEALDRTVSKLQDRIQGQAMQIGRLREALKRAGVQPEGEQE